MKSNRPKTFPEDMISPKPRRTRVLDGGSASLASKNLEVVPESGAENVNEYNDDPLSYSSFTLANDRSQLSEDVELWLTGYTSLPETTPVNRVMPAQRSAFATTTSSIETNSMWYLLAMMLPVLSINNYLQWSPRGLKKEVSSELFLSSYDGQSNSAIWQREYPLRKAGNKFSVLATTEMFLSRITRICGQAHNHIQRFAEDQGARDILATAMDLVLVVYAIGFLILSLYQASVFG